MNVGQTSCLPLLSGQLYTLSGQSILSFASKDKLYMLSGQSNLLSSAALTFCLLKQVKRLNFSVEQPGNHVACTFWVVYVLQVLQQILIFWTRFCVEAAMNLKDPTAEFYALSSISLLLLSIMFTEPSDQTSHLSLLNSIPQIPPVTIKKI